MSYPYPIYMPVFTYPGGNMIPVSDIPNNAQYRWIDSVGGNSLSGPARMGDLRPDGQVGHGGVMTTDTDGNCVVEYHGGGKK